MAKRGKTGKKVGDKKKSVRRSAHDSSLSIEKTNNIVEQKMKNKMDFASQKLRFKSKRHWMQYAKALLAEGSGVTEGERKLATQLMRKRAISHLTEMFAEYAKRTLDQFEQ